MVQIIIIQGLIVQVLLVRVILIQDLLVQVLLLQLFSRCRHILKWLTNICRHLIAPPSTPDFSDEVGFNFTLGLVTSCCSHQTTWWRPACCWLGWGSMSIGDTIRVGVGVYKNTLAVFASVLKLILHWVGWYGCSSPSTKVLSIGSASIRCKSDRSWLTRDAWRYKILQHQIWRRKTGKYHLHERK